MKEYDVVVIGSGSGMTCIEGAVTQGLSCALIDQGPTGGTCLNTGCIPSKLLIHPADVLSEIQDSSKFGIHANIQTIDFKNIMEDMRTHTRPTRERMYQALKEAPEIDFYDGSGQFIDGYTLEVNKEQIKGKKIFIAAGSRPFIPPLEGIDKVSYLTNETVLDLESLPESLVIVGGGYIAAEYAHFFSAMGTAVTILELGNRMLPAAEPEISKHLQQHLGKTVNIQLHTKATRLTSSAQAITIATENTKDGTTNSFESTHLMIATGRRSNADLLKVEKTGLKLTERGFIQVDDFLKTNKPNIWAFGDIIGKYMFRHVANNESEIAWYNATHSKPIRMDYRVIPSAVFTRPQIASVGMTEQEARSHYDILVGYAKYTDVAKGQAMKADDAFAKAIVDQNSGSILGFHIIGPQASVLIQEVINAMSQGLSVYALSRPIHIHPALPELILRTIGSLRPPEHAE